jgi:hypothetical protein
VKISGDQALSKGSDMLANLMRVSGKPQQSAETRTPKALGMMDALSRFVHPVRKSA